MIGFAGKSGAVAFMVAAELVFAIIAACCSSPQTAEINAPRRSETLMKWVIIGVITATVFILIAAVLEKDDSKHIILGGGLAGAVLGLMYVHANHAGLASREPGTEDC